MKKIFFIITSLLCFCCTLQAQENIIYDESIQTLEVKVNGEWGEPPIILLGGENYIEISFDNLFNGFERYIYTIEHCNSDWQQSDLLVSEYMTGFNDTRIEDYETSRNTEVEYTHYTITLPNEENSLLVSGNYKVKIFLDGEDEPVAVACFSVIEPRVNITASVSGNTDIDSWLSHQQLTFSVNYKGYEIRNPVNDIHIVVTQNRRWDTHIADIKPTYMRNDALIFEHNKSLIFEAGNEFRRFEILDEYTPTMRIDSIKHIDGVDHAWIFVDEPRTAYLYDQDQNGRYWIRNENNEENNTESNYFYTHFTLKTPAIQGNGKLYLYGDLTEGRINPEYEMEYDPMLHAYTGTWLLKQGSYNYQYIYVPNDSSNGTFIPAEGSFHQTENEYYIYVYHRPFGLRYDKFIGFAKITSKE